MPTIDSNPYEIVPVQFDKHFVGREREVRLIEQVLSEGKQSPHRLKSFLITGDEGIGKSSLVQKAVRIAEREHYLVVSTSAAQFRQSRPPLVSYLRSLMTELIKAAEGIPTADNSNPNVNVFEDVADFPTYRLALNGVPLESAQIQSLTTLEFPIWYYAYARNPHSEAGAAPLGPWINDVQLILTMAEQKAEVPGCVIALDNVDALTTDDTRALLDTVRAVYETLSGCRISFILAGSKSLERLVSHQRGVAPIFLDLQLAPWTKREVEEYVRRPELLDHNLMVRDEGIQRLIEDTEGSPAVLSMLCRNIFAACEANEQNTFEPSEAILERVCTRIKGVSNPHVIERINKASHRDLAELAEIAPFGGWTTGEISRFNKFQAWINGQEADTSGHEQRLESIRALYVHRGILKGGSTISIAGTSLERAYLRLWARKHGIPWAPHFGETVPSYSNWVERAVQAFILERSRAVNFPLRAWAAWHAPSHDLPRSIDERAREWITGLSDGTLSADDDDDEPLRMAGEEGRVRYQLVHVDSALKDLATPQARVSVDLLAEKYLVGDSHAITVQIYRLPTNSAADIATVLQAIEPLNGLLDLKALEHSVVHVDLPNLQGVVAQAERTGNKGLLKKCLYAYIGLGREQFDRGRTDASWEWFRMASAFPEELVYPADLANAYNGFAFVSIAKGVSQWDKAEEVFNRVLKMYSPDPTKSFRAMTRYDIGYLQAASGRFTEALETCRMALRDPAPNVLPGYLFVKLCEIDGLNISKYWDAELARDPVVAAAIYCTIGYIHAMQNQMPAAEEAFSNALKADPNHHYFVHRALGHFQLKKGRLPDALQHFERAEQLYKELAEQKARKGELPLSALVPLEDELAFVRRQGQVSGRRGA